MIRQKLAALLLLLLVLVCPMPARAQDAKQENAELREKAMKLLESLAGQLGSLQSLENRARIGSNLAGSLWPDNEERARAILASVEQDIRAGLQPVEYYDDRHRHTLMVFLKLRADTVQRIAKHDAKAALTFFKATAPDLGDKMPYEAIAAERAIEMELAKQVAAESPEIAIDLGRQSLARGLSPEVLTILRRVGRKNKEQARILHQEILETLKSIEFPRSSEDMSFAQGLVHSFAPPAADDATFRELINFIITSALKIGCDKPADDEHYEKRWNCGWLGSIMNFMERVDPSRAAKLKEWKPEYPAPEGMREAYLEIDDTLKAGNLDDVVALAAKYPEMSNEIYRGATMRAIGANDIERARKIVAGITEPGTQQWLTSQIETSSEWSSINEEKLAELQKALTETPRIDERAGVLLFAANRMISSDKRMALKLLNQAEDNIAAMRPGRDQMKAQLTAAGIHCLLKNDRCFTIVEHLVPKLNELVDAAVRLDGFDTDYMRENEWNMSATGNVGDTLTMLANNAGYFAWNDFDRAVALASQFDRTEIRMMAQLKLGQSILAGPPTGMLVPVLHTRLP